MAYSPKLPPETLQAIQCGPVPTLRNWRKLPLDKQTRGERVCSFVEAFCKVPEGKLVGKPVKLEVFQEAFILAIYDNPAGTARAYLGISRKNGKSALIACILLAHVAGPEARQNSQIVSGARSRDQAALVFKLAEKMVRMSPELSDRVKVVPSEKKLVGLHKNVEYKAISAEAGTAHGLSPVLAILDETGQVKGPVDGFIEAIETAQGAHENPLLVTISTQAATDADLFSIWLDDAKESKDPRIVSHLYTAPENCDVMDKSAWKAANPALGKFRSMVDLEDFATQAARLPAKENSFRWLFLNQRIDGTSPFIVRSEWEKCAAKPDFEALKGRACWGGLDLSISRDLTAFALVFPDDGRVDVLMRFWLPMDGLLERSKSDRVPYDTWVKNGFISATPGPTIDPTVVAKDIAALCDVYDVRKIAYDRWRIQEFKRELERAAVDLPLEEFGQGYKAMSPALDKLEKLVADASLRHGGNPVLNMCAANAIVEQDPAGNRKLTKAKSNGRIDGLVALTMALSIADDGYGSYLDKEGLWVI